LERNDKIGLTVFTQIYIYGNPFAIDDLDIDKNGSWKLTSLVEALNPTFTGTAGAITLVVVIIENNAIATVFLISIVIGLTEAD
jgi:hypothetical protein